MRVSCPYCGSLHPREVSASATSGEPMREVCPLVPMAGERLDAKFAIVRELRLTATGPVFEATDLAQNRPGPTVRGVSGRRSRIVPLCPVSRHYRESR